jgi:hypothetical protein
MIGHYKCKCGNVIVFKKKIGKNFPMTKKCGTCGKRAKRDYNEVNVIVPHHMKSTTA